MKCTYCETELPVGAMFCGECGRAVTPGGAAPHRGPARSDDPGVVRTSTITPPPRAREVPPVEMPTESAATPAVEPDGPAVESDEPAIEPAVESVAVPVAPPTPPARPETAARLAAEPRCESCGATLQPGDIFCGECGDVVDRVMQRPPRPAGDTVVIEPVDQVLTFPEPGAVRPPTPDPAPHPEPAAKAPAPPIPVPISHGAHELSDDDDVEATRIVRPGSRGERFVLQFSTGQSVTVSGTGLVGRNPMPEPGEFFDTIVRVVDPTRSVSKVHLEFGQQSGSFWISDRFSGNGSILREPDAEPRRIDPGKRYHLVRGTRVDIGEQFFVVS